MAVPLPNLDDRRWVDLAEEARSLIPLYAPAWTDHNIHDPGIMLTELFAWIAEMDIYWLNRIPAQHRRQFLALVGVQPNPPRPSQAVLHIRPANNINHLTLPADVQFVAHNPNGQPVLFRSLHPITLVPGDLTGLRLWDGEQFTDLTERRQRGELFDLLGPDPKPGMALYFGFSHAFPKNVPVTLHFTFAGEHATHDERLRIAAEVDRQAHRCRTPNVLTDCEPKRPFPPPHTPHPPLQHHSVRLVWEYLRKAGTWRALDPAKNEVLDETRALTLNGRVRLTLPADDMDTMPLGVEAQSQYAVRCRFRSGRYDAPPRLQSVVLNGLRVEQAGRRQDEAEQVGIGTGLPEQVVQVGETAVLPSTLHLHTLEENGRQTWQQRDDFNDSTPADAHFLLDATSGVITFGDGNRGRVVPAHAPIMADYRATQAAAGNLKANTITALADTPHNQALLTTFSQLEAQLKQITNPLPAGGGAPAETVDQATGRALQLLEQPQRAVTADDVVTLAYETPGVRIARAAAWVNQHPDFPCFKASGMITLIVMPFLPADRPMPSAALRRQVAAYLNVRRVVGSRVEIVGPTYTEVGVEASVRACAGVNPAALQQQIVTNLDRFLHPLTGGPEGSGWPFGRDVVRSEVLQVIDETPGVDYVLSLTLRSDGCDPVCGNVCLGPRGLVAAKTHEIEVV